jgi:uracil-DNA glycosylase family 4
MKVQDVGPFGAPILIVGEAPGREEAQKGVPFVGASGKLLKNMLQHVGIKYNNCYVTNVVNERPPNNNFKSLYEDKGKTPTQYLQNCWKTLREKVKEQKPNVVLCLGAEPLRALTNKIGIKDWRGSIIPMLGTKIIPTYHPAYILRVYNDHPIFELDASKAKEQSLFRDYNDPPNNILLKPDITDTIHFINNVTKRVSFDLETVGQHIRCIGLATGSIKCPRAIVIPFISFQNTGGFNINKGILKISNGGTPGTSYWTAENELIVLDFLNKLFEDKDIEIVGQNSMSFDAPLLKRHFRFEIINHYMDTMHAHHDLYSELPMSLNFLTTMYTEYSNYWSDKVTENDMSEWLYCAKDAIVTYISSYKIEENLIASNMKDYYFNIRRPLALALADAQIEGLDINETRRAEILKEQKEKLKDLQDNISKVAKTEINPNSHPQIKDLLYNKMGFPKVYNDGKVTVDEKALRALENKYPNTPVLEYIIMYRKTQKLISTYLLAKTDSDGKMRTSWNPSGTKSGRISSSKTIWKTGLQMQNIPKGHSRGVTNIRDIFIAGATQCSCQS